MRVALACPYAWDAPGGVQTHVRQLAEELVGRGHDVLVLAPGNGGPDAPWVRIVGRTIRIPYRGTVAQLCFSLRSRRRVRDELANFAPDVVHAHEPLTPSTSMLAVLASPSPVLATFHAYLDRSRLLLAAAPALRPVWRRIQVRIAVSEAAAIFAARAVPGHYEVVPNGVDVRLFRAADPAGGLPPGRRLLWVNRLDPQKGLRVALSAFELLEGELADLSFIVVGDGPEREALAGLRAEVRARVHALGTVPHRELPPYHAACHAFVAPATGQESFGIALVEAMAAGLPVLASDIPGYREVLRDGVEGLLVRPSDPAALAAALRRVLEDPELSARMGRAGRERAEEFSWERVVPQLEELYADAAGGRSGPRSLA